MFPNLSNSLFIVYITHENTYAFFSNIFTDSKCIFLPGDNTFDANTAVYNNHLGQKLYEGYGQLGRSTQTEYSWIFYLSRIYSIRHITFLFNRSKQNLNSFVLRQFTKI